MLKFHSSQKSKTRKNLHIFWHFLKPILINNLNSKWGKINELLIFEMEKIYILFNSDRNYFMFFQFFFMGWKTDFTVLGFFFTLFSTSEENDEEMVFFTVFFTCGENSEEKS